MRLSTNTDMMFSAYGVEKSVEIFAKAGFDALDFSFFNEKYYAEDLKEEYFSEIRKKAESVGLVFNQAHAPFASSFEDEAMSCRRFDEIVRAMRNASYLGVENIIVHPCQHLAYNDEGNAEKLFEINMDFYNRLKPYCEEYGIKVALENMWQSTESKWWSAVESKCLHSTCASPSEFIKYLDELNSECFVACLDIGHAMLVGENPAAFIKQLGNKRLKALHVHDVDGVHDSHTLPYFGMINWESVTKALADIDYKGDFTFEAGCFMKGQPEELYPNFLQLMAGTGRYLINKIENFKK